MAPGRRTRSSGWRRIGSSPDPRARAARPRLLKKKGKKLQFASLGKIVEENADPNKTGNTEAAGVSECVSLSNVNEEQSVDAHLSPEKQDITEDAVSSRGTRTKRKSLTSENKDYEKNSNIAECDEGELERRPLLNKTPDRSASSSSFLCESNDFDEESSLSPEQSRDDHSESSPLYYESYDDIDFSEVYKENECSLSPEQVREDNSQSGSEESAFVQKLRGIKNSTLMEVSKAQAISDMSRTFNISPIKEDCFSESITSHLDLQEHFDPTSILVPDLIRKVPRPEEISRSAEHSRKDGAPASTLISGKPLYKLRKIDDDGRNSTRSPRAGDSTISKVKFRVSDAHQENADRVNYSLGFVSQPLSTSAQVYLPPNTQLNIPKCSSMESESIVPLTMFRVPAERMNHSLGFVNQPLSTDTQVYLLPNTLPHWPCEPKPVNMKRVRFCDPLTTEISDPDPHIPKCSSTESESVVPPTMAEVSFILKDLASQTDAMFLHHPMLRVLEKSGRKYF